MIPRRRVFDFQLRDRDLGDSVGEDGQRGGAPRGAVGGEVRLQADAVDRMLEAIQVRTWVGEAGVFRMGGDVEVDVVDVEGDIGEGFAVVGGSLRFWSRFARGTYGVVGHC